jgi:multicomponent Na+:H+ antiporter subunit A
MRLPPLLIALLALEFEFLPTLADPLLLAAAQSVSPGLDAGVLDANYHFDNTLTALEITLGLGLLLFLFWDRLHALGHRIHWLDRYGPAAAYEHALHGLARLAAGHTRLLQHGRLSGYLRGTLAALLALAGIMLWLEAPLLAWPATSPKQAVAWSVALVLIAAGAVAALTLRDRLALLMASGLVGYGSAVLFLFAGAPDLAFTQFAVETVLVVVAATALPHFRGEAPRLKEPRLANALLALLAGAGVFLLLLPLAALPPDTALSDWFAAHSLEAAHGRNVVNVIIVDFRGLDTLGEIAVVAASLLAALPLLAGLRNRNSVA